MYIDKNKIFINIPASFPFFVIGFSLEKKLTNFAWTIY